MYKIKENFVFFIYYFNYLSGNFYTLCLFCIKNTFEIYKTAKKANSINFIQSKNLI